MRSGDMRTARPGVMTLNRCPSPVSALTTGVERRHGDGFQELVVGARGLIGPGAPLAARARAVSMAARIRRRTSETSMGGSYLTRLRGAFAVGVNFQLPTRRVSGGGAPY